MPDFLVYALLAGLGLALVAGLLALSACEEVNLGLAQSLSPPVRPPAGIVPQVRPRAEPSAASLDLVRYYTSVERDLLTRGLLGVACREED